MKNKFYFITVFFLLTPLAGIAQNLELNYQTCTGCPQGPDANTPINDDLFEYENSTAYETGDIESDFDLRRANGNSRWHKGLDLRNHGGVDFNSASDFDPRDLSSINQVTYGRSKEGNYY